MPLEMTAAPSAETQSKGSVLVVDDELDIREGLDMLLTGAGYAVELAQNGIEGIQKMSARGYDLVLLDLMMPGMSGSEILRRLRAAKKDVPVLILSARDRTAEKVEHFEAGADDYLTKPFAFAELLVRVKALLRRGAAVRDEVLQVADLELDRRVQQVRRAGKKIDLTSKEYALLEYLALNAGRVLSRTMIVEHVWDQSFEGLTNIVDVYVRHLRGKVDDGHAQKLIRTVRGVGYSISDEQDA